MKSHISATIDQDILARVDRYRRGVKRSRSQVIEIAIEKLLREEQPESTTVVTSTGQFTGEFSRNDTYER
ncbi:ribbon-helix-helix protein, CopG family [Coraliomargarita algicola]|jgi:metal-responsive CopG/Arc/MetJ family transcriptional regulator|uniref:Ribbon-helix-helix protein, CopG family n=1 Tax=Coraliomargarita algicola TaxID=3092156 RepID=A0ABZ0RPZ3_9BACT|nr:ribbon-helix-helix protein, CopG family [Coraliomargarita sp. J2-16]WPJ97314.1 ribbon-helix-helix protein, CopG family [Coraliomargarita sp. J2-16]